MAEIRPSITVLSEDQVIQVHQYALSVLTTVGIRVDSPRARDVFNKAIGCEDNDHVVKIPPELVEWAIKAAPSDMDIYDRRGQFIFKLGDPQKYRSRFGIGVTNLNYQDPVTDNVEPFQRKHMQICTRLGNTLENFDFVSTIGVLQDCKPDIADFYATLEMVANTIKPLVLLVSEEHNFEAVLDLLEHLTGDLTQNPSVIPYFNPITPLVLNAGTTDKMFTTIARGMPFIFSNYSLIGASAPIRPAGALALLTAELLAGLVFAQLVKEGTPVVLGSLPATFSMKGGTNLYTPDSMTLNLACAELMGYYGLPHFGTSGSGAGWGADLPASDLLWLNHLTSCIGKVGMATFVGGNFDSLVFSPAIAVYSDEIIRQARQFAGGFDLTDETVGIEEMQSVGPGGSFLMAESTVRLCREAQRESAIWSDLTLDKWRTKGSPKADQSLRDYTAGLLQSSRPPEDHDELITKGEAFIRKQMAV